MNPPRIGPSATRAGGFAYPKAYSAGPALLQTPVDACVISEKVTAKVQHLLAGPNIPSPTARAHAGRKPRRLPRLGASRRACCRTGMRSPPVARVQIGQLPTLANIPGPQRVPTGCSKRPPFVKGRVSVSGPMALCCRRLVEPQSRPTAPSIVPRALIWINASTWAPQHSAAPK
jgi:hypothetical protein